MTRFPIRVLSIPLACLLLQSAGWGQQAQDEAYTQAIRDNTTDPANLTEWVDHLPASDSVPTPKDFLGYAIGSEGKLTHPDQILAYFDALAESSDRIRVLPMGESHGGRPMIVVAIAEPGILERMDEIQKANQRLSDPRLTNEATARRLSAQIPPTYYITAGLHSTETGPPEMVMELAYRLAVSEAPHIKEIRSRVLTLITPVLEMDGRARVVEWNRRHLQGVTDLGNKPPTSPPYWGDYTFHDNNRDGLQASQPLTRNYNRAYHKFRPTVSLDLHESVPLLYVSMGTGPYNETISPITITEWQWMAAYDVSQATKLGLKGVWTWGFYTGWYPGYLLWVTNNHNAVGRFYETFGNSLPGTFERDLKDSEFASERVDSRQWYRPNPPARKLKWSMRDNTNYMQTGVLAALQLAARNGETLLFNYWQKGANSLERGKTEAPYAFVMPQEQRDGAALEHALQLLHEHGIEVQRAQADASFGELQIAAGDFVVAMDQPFRKFATTLLSKQSFPADAEHTPYDDISWSLPLMLGIEAQAVDDGGVQSMELAPYQGPWENAARVPMGMAAHASRQSYIIDNHAQSSLAGLAWAAARFHNVTLQVLTREFNAHPAGSLVLGGMPQAQMKYLGAKYSLSYGSNNLASDAPLNEFKLPRIGLYHTWTYTQDSGWARYSLEQLGIPYELISKDDLIEGDLGERFELILVPNTGGQDLKGIVHGIDTKWSPLAYETSDLTPSHGLIDHTPDMTGGMGFAGLGHLQDFVQQGGTLVTLGSAGLLAADSGIARGVSSLPAAGTPGSHISTRVLRPGHPSMYGYGQYNHVFHGNLPLFRVPESAMGQRVMQFGSSALLEAEAEADRQAGVATEANAKAAGDDAERPELCLSGLVPDAKKLERRAALLDVPSGLGHVLIYAWNPLHRFQNRHDFAYLTNVLLFQSLLPGTPTEAEARALDER